MKRFPPSLWLLLLLLSPASGEELPPKPPDIARQLLQVYGRKLDDATYIPALAVHCRWRFGKLADEPQYCDQALQLVAPYVQGGKTPRLDSQVGVAGHLAFVLPEAPSEAAQLRRLVQSAADSLLRDDGEVRPPKLEEMSDAVFMCGPVLCEAGTATKEAQYFDAAADYLIAMAKLRQRDDGLYSHGHLCDAAWGRGNGFAAVGMAWCLTGLPKSQQMREDLIAAYRRHMEALLKHQDHGGMWRQVIDVPASDPEFSCTAMIGFAMQRGLRETWLPPRTYEPAVKKAWQALCLRIEPDGKLRGVCESTGTQPTLEAYLRRRLNHGIDPRGGALALLFATELMDRPSR